MMNVLQINLQRSATAQSLATQTAAAIGAQVLLISEQNWSPTRDARWTVSSDRTCAVVLTANADFAPDSTGSGRGFAWIQSRSVRIYSCYLSRNDTEVNFENFLGDVEQSVRSVDPHCSVILGGDYNAWSQEWGSARNDARGNRLADLAASLELIAGNVGNTPTYRRINAESVIDVTFHRIQPPLTLTGWRVMDEVASASDHRYITYTLDSQAATEEPPEHLRGWSYRRLDVEALASHLSEAPLPQYDGTTSANEAADQLVNYLSSACDSCMPPRAAPPAGRRNVHWWNRDIALLREDFGKALRKLQRAGRRHDPPDQLDLLRAAYRAKRKELRLTIRASQAKSWSDLCAAVDSDPWGLPYRVVTKRIGRHRPGMEARGKESEIADHLFPNPPATDWSRVPLTPRDADEDPPTTEFTAAELCAAAKRLPSGKATGPDGIPNEVLAKVALLRPQVLLSAFNSCLAHSTFPPRWKESRLVLLHKGPGKPVSEPSSYRPLCMLDSSGKLLERLILTRLDEHLDSTGLRSPNQYGFRRGWSTEDAIERLLKTAYGAALGAVQHRDLCVAVSLDVKNAFNTAPWIMIDAALRRKNVPPYLVRLIRSYLQDRHILVGQTLLRRSTTCGVPQGSVLGPALWNVFYDELLDMETPHGVQLVAFADDVCVLGISRSGESATTLMNPVLGAVANWMNTNGLQLAPAKTEAIVLTRKHLFNDPELTVEGHAVPVKRTMRYLGVELDTRLLFTTHVHQASAKASESARAIGRLMPNIGGPSQSKRALLGTVANSKMLYAAAIWATQGTKTAKNRNQMARAQRSVAIRTTRAYRTVSADASSLLASMVPADIVANERARIRQRLDDQDDTTPKSGIKAQERAISVRAWQTRWDRSPNGRWTHRLLPDVGRWLARPPLGLTYHLTQALSGHGCFRRYLYDRERADDSYCCYCMNPNDTAEHTLFACPRWVDDRAVLTRILRRPPEAGDVQEILCGPLSDDLPDDPSARSRLVEQARVNRQELINMVEAIMSAKEADEREEQSSA